MKAELFNDINPETTVTGLGFKNQDVAIKSIIKVENYFDNLQDLQKIPGLTPSNVKPKKLITNRDMCKKYYQNQKMTRILSLYNRGKVMIKRIKDPREMKKAVKILYNWIQDNKIGGDDKKGPDDEIGLNDKIPYCCDNPIKESKCRRKSDKKVFDLPRKFSYSDCSDIRGFSMRSSCAPYKDCYQ